MFRISVAATLVSEGLSHSNILTSSWAVAALAILATLLCIGFLTPLCCTLCCLVELGLLLFTASADYFHTVVSIGDAGILAVLGPGAFSIDSRIFGRRLLIVNPPK